MLLGLGIGAFGALVGAGGGFILMPILLFLYPQRDPEELTSISLVFVFMNAVSGSVAYARQRVIDHRSAIWFALGTLPGSVAGVLTASLINRQVFEAVFALALLAIALHLVFHQPPTGIRVPKRGRWTRTRCLTDRSGSTFVYSFRLWQGVLLSGAIGYLGALLGIGGGPIQVPMLVVVLHFPVHIAVGTSQLVVAGMSGQASAVHLLSGHLGLERPLVQAGMLSLGAIPGAQAGAWIGHRLPGPRIQKLLAVSLLLIGLRLASSAISGPL